MLDNISFRINIMNNGEVWINDDIDMNGKEYKISNESELPEILKDYLNKRSK